LPSPDVWTALAARFANTFISRRDTYPLQQANGAYISVKKPLRSDLIVAHLTGSLTLGAYALDSDSKARWLCFDADELEQWWALKAAAIQLEDNGLVPYLEHSRRGGHLWLFTAPLAGAKIRAFGRWIAATYGLPKTELYPKQDSLKTGPGSLVRLPLGIHRKTGKRYPFITPSGEPLAPTIRQQIALLSAPVLVAHDVIEQAIAELPDHPLPAPVGLSKRPTHPDEPLSERLKAAISVFDFVSRYVVLDELGKAKCPFHDDRIASFQVNRIENYWHCYAGCGGGSIIDFMSKWRQLHGQDPSFTATIKDLANLLL
jgi:hypothetical protein